MDIKQKDFLDGTVDKNPPASVGDTGLISKSGQSSHAMGQSSSWVTTKALEL